MEGPIPVELSPTQREKLAERAQRLGIAPADLARALVADALDGSEADFLRAAEIVLEKNQDLYERLG